MRVLNGLTVARARRLVGLIRDRLDNPARTEVYVYGPGRTDRTPRICPRVGAQLQEDGTVTLLISGDWSAARVRAEQPGANIETRATQRATRRRR